MRIKILASGSTGNCTYVETADHKLLIDVGISKKAIESGLESIGISLDRIDTLLITHEHDDHIRSLGALLKKNNLTTYMTQGTYQAIMKGKNPILATLLASKLESSAVILLNRLENSMHYPDISLDSTDIQVLPTFHDAQESVGYKIRSQGRDLVYLTDTGYIHHALYPMIANADCYVIECNHDPNILMCSSRPYALKMRILSDHGHLSNEDAMVTLAHIMGIHTKLIFYAHISQECNLVEIIEMTRKKVMADFGLDTSHIRFIAAQACGTEVHEL
ncbi:MAG TPA: MBL fold metallo-hydrolase [Candidatus Pelethenecus faecipullorum]|uniref:MBL fold metallo-hydrolase n=1 Tax=Candidatus Pelethenecus faecipullorum TaxID=2840900 RepID=A0A9D1GQV6_9MOLU|nr:MBL fold metallo-hydrolase [Candidatus Pelethenecus faecipullorum]